ncbi:hypothetical protein [Chitinimonas naiadis]
MQFQIEQIIRNEKHAMLIACTVDEGDFSLSEHAQLGDIKLNPRFLVAHRAGTLGRKRLYTFATEDLDALSSLAQGAVLELKT